MIFGSDESLIQIEIQDQTARAGTFRQHKAGGSAGNPPRRSRTTGRNELVRPPLDLRAEPELAPPTPERNYRPRHVVVSVLVDADVIRVRQAEDLRDAAGVD
jgi:hypothetical protein